MKKLKGFPQSFVFLRFERNDCDGAIVNRHCTFFLHGLIIFVVAVAAAVPGAVLRYAGIVLIGVWYWFVSFTTCITSGTSGAVSVCMYICIYTSTNASGSVCGDAKMFL